MANDGRGTIEDPTVRRLVGWWFEQQAELVSSCGYGFDTFDDDGNPDKWDEAELVLDRALSRLQRELLGDGSIGTVGSDTENRGSNDPTLTPAEDR